MLATMIIDPKVALVIPIFAAIGYFVGGWEMALWMGLGLGLGHILIWWFRFRPDRIRIELLQQGKLDEFHVSVDKAIKLSRTRSRRRILLMNKASAYAQTGDFADGVEQYDRIDPNALQSTVRCLYYLNLLNMLVYCDPERARKLREEQRDLLDPARNERLGPHLVDVEHTYRLMVEGDDSGEAHFRVNLERGERIKKAFAYYHLAVIARQRGQHEEAARLHQEGQDYWPSLRLAAPSA